MGENVANVWTVLGLESSCDETAAAVVRLESGRAQVLSNVVFSQMAAHAPYGGVVPEIAARAHVSAMDVVVKQAMAQANIGYAALDGVAATAGPGLIGGVMVGLMAGKAIALAAGKPLLGVNHLEGHALSPRLEHDCPFPYLLLLVSGGHCQILWVEGLGAMTRIGTTIDDAVGEAFDKVAKTLGLGYPGGPNVENMAKTGDPKRFDLPISLMHDEGRYYDFSFAGLKTAVLRQAQSLAGATSDGILGQQDCADLCASFQNIVAQTLVAKMGRAIEKVRKERPMPENGWRMVVAGGVAANLTIRAALNTLCQQQNFTLLAPSLKYCGDNGAMIALVGAQKLAMGESDDLSMSARPRWPLDSWAATHAPSHQAGHKGAKS